MKAFAVALAALLMLSTPDQRPPQFEEAPPPELQRLDFLLGEWTGELNISLYSNPPMSMGGVLAVQRHMSGHALSLEARAKGKLVAEGRLTYDSLNKEYRGVFLFAGLAGGWHARGSLVGKELKLRARGIEADYGELDVRLRPQGSSLVVDFKPSSGGHKDDRITLTLKKN
jgi:hypothetical protein